MSIVLNGSTGITTPDIDSTGGLDAADLTGTLPAIDGSALTSLAAANLTGTLPALDGSSLTGIKSGSLDFVATGAIPSGSTVGLLPDGTVSVVTNPFPDIEASGLDDYTEAAYDTINNKILVIHKDGNNVYGRVGTISNGTITFGSLTTVFTHTHFTYQYELAFDPSAGKFAFLFSDAYHAYKGNGVVITISGDTFTTGSMGGSALVSTNSSAHSMAYHEVVGKLVAVYRKNGQGVFASLVTISGTTVSLTGEVQVGASNNANDPSICYNSDEDQCIVYYQDTGTDASYVRTLNVSGSTITFGSEATVHTVYGNNLSIAYDPVNSRFLTARYRTAAGPALELCVGTVSGSTITLGGYNTSVSGSVNNVHAIFNPHTENFFVVYDQNGSKIANVNTSSGPSISKVGTVTLGEVHSDFSTGGAFAVVFSPDDNLVFLNSNGRAALYDSASPISSVVGISAESISDGDTGSVLSIGGLVEGFSGLTPSLYHYIQADGSVAISSTDKRLGFATSPTDLIVTL